MLRAIAIATVAGFVAAPAYAETEWQRAIKTMSWAYNPAGKTAILGVPETDNTPISLRCVGKGRVEFEAPYEPGTLKKLPNGGLRAVVKVGVYRDTAEATVDGAAKTVKDESSGDYTVFVSTISPGHELIKLLGDADSTEFWQDKDGSKDSSDDEDVYPLKGAPKVIKRLLASCK
ncbi:hypothetical protein [Microvirga sp. Mcv34]|uniref:hypothetical protein n=1 Tax=Microvirga sp. Mcv34 TaxID=2926016 RepID=UPI0021C89593|nr:hypothetical protein [Microvirga sp. Mcv34]